MNINFRQGERKDIDLMYKFFSQKDLGYKGFNEWLPKAMDEYICGIKEVMLGFSDDVLISALLNQSCKHLRGFRELKSGRTIDEYARRLCLSFIIRQVEYLAKEERGEIGVICDARLDKVDTLSMLYKIGYKEIARADLYNEGKIDVVLMKPLVENFSFDIN